ncbi:MAG TPA: sensor histidine kinase KdpD, partial [Nitrococcus sp.]|nr:sensor histidine kinase KdpD [Nitrococcus sp.]
MADRDERPDPDALLADMDREQGGGLKIFLGAAPGVGKTYAMLLAAREARKEGRDVVAGVIESHGRQETEVLCENLE